MSGIRASVRPTLSITHTHFCTHPATRYAHAHAMLSHTRTHHARTPCMQRIVHVQVAIRRDSLITECVHVERSRSGHVSRAGLCMRQATAVCFCTVYVACVVRLLVCNEWDSCKCETHLLNNPHTLCQFSTQPQSQHPSWSCTCIAYQPSLLPGISHTSHVRMASGRHKCTLLVHTVCLLPAKSITRQTR
jgi:hypothetical protein